MSNDIADYIEKRDAKDRDKDEQLRELISAMRSEAKDADNEYVGDAINHYADRLARVLDGEK